MSVEFALPGLGEGVESADVVELLVSEGDEIEADQTVMEIETEKAVVDVPCPHAGLVEKVHVASGDEVKPGDVLLTIEESDRAEDDRTEEDRTENDRRETERAESGDTESESAESESAANESREKKRTVGERKTDGKPSDSQERVDREQDERPTRRQRHDARGKKSKPPRRKEQPADDKPQPADRKQSAPTKSKDKSQAEQKTRQAEPPSGTLSEDDPLRQSMPSPAASVPETETIPASPATRRLARSLEVSLRTVHGTGAEGRITERDVVRSFRDQAGASGSGQRRRLPDFDREGSVERQTLSRLEESAAELLTYSAGAIPQVTQHGRADITDLERARVAHNRTNGDPRISLTAVSVKLSAVLLADFPRFNASLDEVEQEIVLRKEFHIGVAVDTPAGLLVPVIRDADRKPIAEIARELTETAQAARKRELDREQLQGATFTVSNQGPVSADQSAARFAGTGFTPLVTWPQSAILGLSRARLESVVIENDPEVRLMLPLSLSYDHRLINGADAERFVMRLAELLSEPFELLVRL